MAIYDYINQQIQSSLLVLPKDNDPFFNQVSLGLTGFASNGRLYDGGVLATAPFGPFPSLFASWYSEPQGTYRGPLPSFPAAALVLLSEVALTVLDETNPVTTSGALPLWMQFILQDFAALTNNFKGGLVGFTPSGLSYSTGVLAVTYTPDPGSTIQSELAVNIDFTLDSVYLYVAVAP